MSIASRLFCSLLVVASSAACAAPSTDEVLDPNAVVIDKSTHALKGASVEWVNGTYSASCKNPDTGAARTEGEAWSLRISGGATMSHSALKVTKGDGDCTLSLTGIQAGALYDASPGFAMGAAFQSAGSAFSTGGGALAFYGNAKLSATDMASDFTVTILVSDDLATASSGKTGSYAQFSGMGEAGEVAAPAYSISNTITFESTDDHKVSSTAGGIGLNLAEGAQSGDQYRIVSSAIPDATFASVDTAWTEAAGGAPVTIEGPIALESSALLANGASLPAYRTVIVRRSVNGVPAYQIFNLSFAPPPAG